MFFSKFWPYKLVSVFNQWKWRNILTTSWKLCLIQDYFGVMLEFGDQWQPFLSSTTPSSASTFSPSRMLVRIGQQWGQINLHQWIAPIYHLTGQPSKWKWHNIPKCTWKVPGSWLSFWDFLLPVWWKDGGIKWPPCQTSPKLPWCSTAWLSQEKIHCLWRRPSWDTACCLTM